MLLSFTIDPNTLSLFLWQSETERKGDTEGEENEVNNKNMRWKHTQTYIYIRHKGNRNLLNKKQFKEFLTNQKKKQEKIIISQENIKKGSQKGILTNGQWDERNPLWISFVQYSYAEFIMFPAVLETKIETDSELEKTLNRNFYSTQI